MCSSDLSTRPLNFWLTESNWRKDREGTLECDAAIKPITLAADWPAQSQTCRMESGGWPALLFATRIAGRDYVGQAIPSQAKVTRAESQMMSANPRYAGLTLPRVVTAAEAARLLGPDEAIVQIADTAGRTYVHLARKDGSAYHASTLPASEIGKLVASLRAGVDWSEGTPKDFDLEAAHTLYNQILAPIEGRLAGIKNLYVVARGPFASLPMGVLVTAPASGRDYRNAAWLAKRYSISVLPSARALADLRGARAGAAAAQPFLGVANPRIGGSAKPTGVADFATACLAGEQVNRALFEALPPLPETEAEVGEIARTLGAGGSLVVGAQATKAAIKTRDLSQFRVLSFATHAILPADRKSTRLNPSH